jgi:serine/threonine-protein kinase RsbW
MGIDRGASACATTATGARGRAYDRFETRFSANPDAVRRALRNAVARFARRLTREEAGTMELALAEVLNNVVEHAYSGQAAGDIALSVTWRTDHLACLVEDRGRPMPGLCAPHVSAPSLDCAQSDLPEGGFGWFLIRELTLDLTYRHEDGVNRLRFCLPLGAAAVTPN